jgi:hypothetical protein
MSISNQELAKILNDIQDEVAHNVIYKLATDKKFGFYNQLPGEQLQQRTYPPLKAIVAAVEAGSFGPLQLLLDRIFEQRLRAGYEPNMLLRVIDLFAEEYSKAAIATHPGDETFANIVRRRLTFLNNSCRLHLANLNLAIPIAERVEIDPDLRHREELVS